MSFLYLNKKIIHNYSTHIPTVQISPILIEKAIDISMQTQFSFWDSLIISAANYAKCNILYSEDLNNGQIVEDVAIKIHLNHEVKLFHNSITNISIK